MHINEQRVNGSLYTGWIVFWVTASFYFYDYLLRLAPAVMMDSMIEQYKFTVNQFALIDASFYYAYTPLQLFAGPLIDEYGTKRIVPMATVACLLGTLIAASAASFHWHLASRLLIGFGSAFAFVAVLKSASEWLPSSYYPFLSGLTTTLGMIGGVVAEITLPSLLKYGSFAFYMCAAALALLILVLALLFLKDPPHSTKNTESELNKKGINLSLIFTDIYTVLSRSITWRVGLIGCFLFTPIQIYITWSKSFHMHAMHISEETSGMMSSMLFWGLAISAPMVGWLSNFFATWLRKYLLAFCSVCSAIMMSVLLSSSHHWSVESTSALLFFIGVSTASQPLVFVIIKDAFPAHLTATAVASVNMIVNLSSYLQPFIGQMIQSGQSVSFELASWQRALSILPIMLLISFVLSITLSQQQGNTPHEHQPQ